MRKLVERLFEPVPADRLAWFRILFGGLMAWEAWRYLANGWVRDYYVEPIFHFKYYGFGWIEPLAGDGMYLVFTALGMLALAIAFGWRYRLSMQLFSVLFLYVFLLDSAFYLNHWYLIAIVAFLMALIGKPAFGATVPAWNLWLLRGQILLVYFFAAVAKLDGDWLSGAAPDALLSGLAMHPIIGAAVSHPWAPFILGYGGFCFDLLIGPALLWRRTRTLALIASTIFHLTNAVLFPIGVFPWLMLAITFTLFASARPASQKTGGVTTAPSASRRRLVIAFLSVWALVQTCVPLRHLLYPGDANWTGEGQRFAWRMMLQSSQGELLMISVDPRTGAARRIPVETALTPKQQAEMLTHPDMILLLAHHTAALIEANMGVRPAIHVIARVALNGRPPQDLINPNVDLAGQVRTLGHSAWIMPLEK